MGLMQWMGVNAPTLWINPDPRACADTMESYTMSKLNVYPNTGDLDDIESWYAARETALFNTMAEIRQVFENPINNRPSEYIEAVRLAYWLLNIASEGDDVTEYQVGDKLNGIALGQVIMEHTNPDGLVNKRLWFDVGNHIGPDFAQGLYHAAVFTSKVA